MSKSTALEGDREFRTSPVGQIAFVDLQEQRRRLGNKIEETVGRVLAHGAFIMGPEVSELEERLAAYAGVKHCITCASGTDAIQLALMALKIGPGDAVFVPALSFVATVEPVVLLGATPIFVDVDRETFTLDPNSLAGAASDAVQQGLKPRVVIPVDFYGHPADYKAIFEISGQYGMAVIGDAAQGFGATRDGNRVGALADITATSFFPSKPLGCYGDGGAVLTDNDEIAVSIRSLRIHGMGRDKFDNVRIGLNSRLDTIQAAILLEKLKIFDDEQSRRKAVADFYDKALSGLVQTPVVASGAQSAWANYTIVVDERDKLSDHLGNFGVPAKIYYAVPLNRQVAYAHFPAAPGGVPIAENLAEHVLSLPMHPYLNQEQQTFIIDSIRGGLNV